MDAVAKAGYAVFAPNHRDAACGNLRAWFQRPEVPFRETRNWTDATYADCAQDVEKLLDALLVDPHYASRLDWKRVGLAGHSLGGYTVL
jgi:predicted dienelactone hydrolase